MSVVEWGGDWEVREADVPSPSARRTGREDPRERQQTLHRIYGRKTSMRSDFEKGELTVTVAGDSVPWSEIKYEAAAFRKKMHLSTLVLLLDPDVYPDLCNELSAKGFERDILHEEPRQREFAIVKHYRVKP
jgi:hypothetical protein